MGRGLCPTTDPGVKAPGERWWGWMVYPQESLASADSEKLALIFHIPSPEILCPKPFAGSSKDLGKLELRVIRFVCLLRVNFGNYIEKVGCYTRSEGGGG